MINSFRSVTRAAVFGLVGAANVFNAASADEQSGARTFGPLAGVSLSVGAKRVVGYFDAVAGECTLTLMVADGMAGDDVPNYAPIRVVQTIAPGKSAMVETPEGKSLEFVCRPMAMAMTVRMLDLFSMH